jgi:hypothetical protein
MCRFASHSHPTPERIVLRVRLGLPRRPGGPQLPSIGAPGAVRTGPSGDCGRSAQASGWASCPMELPPILVRPGISQRPAVRGCHATARGVGRAPGAAGHTRCPPVAHPRGQPRRGRAGCRGGLSQQAVRLLLTATEIVGGWAGNDLPSTWWTETVPRRCACSATPRILLRGLSGRLAGWRASCTPGWSCASAGAAAAWWGCRCGWPTARRWCWLAARVPGGRGCRAASMIGFECCAGSRIRETCDDGHRGGCWRALKQMSEQASIARA